MSKRMMMGGAAAVALLSVPLIALARGGSDAGMAMGETMTIARHAAGNPTVGVDGRDGTGFVAWIATADGRSNVFLARVGADGRPGAPVRVNDRPGDAAPHEQAPAQVAVGPDGGVYVLWQNNTKLAGRRFPASDLRFARSTDGGRTFGPAVTVNDDAGGVPSSHTFHDLVVGPDGTVWVSWLDSRAKDAARAARPKPVSAQPAPAGNPHGAAGHGGMGHGGGDDADLPPSEVRVAKSTDGGRTFGPSIVVDTAPCPCCRTTLAVGADGAVYLAWRKEYGGDVRDVVVARMAPGAASFGAPVRVHADQWVFPACPHAGPSLAVDARGRVHVGWYTGKEDRQGLWYARSDDGGRTFGTPEALVTGADITPSQVSLTPRGDGVLLAWDDRPEDGGRHVALARVDGDGRMARIGTVEGRIPALESADGGALVAWHDHQTVYAARLATR
ncbi:sialidase family protein [Longimicrobium sp.]|uniref:sialidase family protein n=1 Tax=Longimicrobium sp. TaxID=2029185 RepID=UPI002E30C444|nr:sialidase family protein [Longimicrobium sp.]HEX6038614.1 sialidase family protein [Longimicrobium sp.]